MKNNRLAAPFKTMRMRSFAVLFIAVLLLAAYSYQRQAQPPQKPHVCQYEKVEGRFRFYDGDGYNIEVKGKAHQIDVARSGRALELFEALKPDIAIVAFEDPKKDNKIFARGKLSTCSYYTPPYIPPDSAGIGVSKYAALSEEQLRQEFADRKFILEQWYIQKPFVEVESDGDTDRYIKKTALKPTDFEFLGYSKNVRRPTPEELKKFVR